jgi:hypothetical protein
MTEQLALIPAPPKLTDRQQFALELLERAGAEGLSADEIGAAWCEQRGRHSALTRCTYCGRNGQGLANELKAKGLARYRRKKGDLDGAWLHHQAPTAPPRPTSGVPYNEFPAEF